MTRADLKAANEEYVREFGEADLVRQLPDETEALLRSIARIKAVAVAVGEIDAYALADHIEQQIELLQKWCG